LEKEKEKEIFFYSVFGPAQLSGSARVCPFPARGPLFFPTFLPGPSPASRRWPS
jgi:hypothetical protein